MNKKCPYYQFKREVIATVTKEKLTFKEAEEKVKDTFRENEKQYSFIVKRNTPKENNFLIIKYFIKLYIFTHFVYGNFFWK